MTLKAFICLCPYGWKKKWQQYLAIPPHQEMESISPPLGSELTLAYFSQWDIHKHENKQRFENHLHIGVFSWNQILCEKVQAILLYTEDMWPLTPIIPAMWAKASRTKQSLANSGAHYCMQAILVRPTWTAYSQTHELIKDSFKQLSKFRGSLLHSSRQLIQSWSFLSDVLFCIP